MKFQENLKPEHMLLGSRYSNELSKWREEQINIKGKGNNKGGFYKQITTDLVNLQEQRSE